MAATNDMIVHFVLGSCPVITFIPVAILCSQLHILTPRDRERCIVSPEWIIAVSPLVVGALFAVLYYHAGIVPRKLYGQYCRFVLCGAIASTLLTVLIRILLGDTFDVLCGGSIPWAWHGGAFLFYIIYFAMVGQWMRYQVLYGPQPSASTSSSKSTKSATTAAFEALKEKQSKSSPSVAA